MPDAFIPTLIGFVLGALVSSLIWMNEVTRLRREIRRAVLIVDKVLKGSRGELHERRFRRMMKDIEARIGGVVKDSGDFIRDSKGRVNA